MQLSVLPGRDLMASPFRIFSYELVSQSLSARIAMCPGCGQEQRLEKRSGRYSVAFLRIPLFPIGKPMQWYSCSVCDESVSENRLEACQQQWQQRQSDALARIESQMLGLFERLDSLPTASPARPTGVGEQRVGEQLGETATAALLDISRAADRLGPAEREQAWEFACREIAARRSSGKIDTGSYRRLAGMIGRALGLSAECVDEAMPGGE